MVTAEAMLLWVVLPVVFLLTLSDATDEDGVRAGPDHNVGVGKLPWTEWICVAHWCFPFRLQHSGQ